MQQKNASSALLSTLGTLRSILQTVRPMTSVRGLALVMAALCAVPAVAHADLYECRGSDGSLHYTNVRQQGMRCRTMVREQRSSMRGSMAARQRPALQGPRPTPPPNVRDPQRYQRYNAFLAEAARVYQLPVAFIRAVVKVESDFNPNVVSHAGAMGLMQLMPRTAASMGVRDPFNPRQNILGGARYLRLLANKFNGDLVLTVAAYNAGQGAVMRYRGVPPYTETRRYVRRVLTHFYEFQRQGH